MNRLRTTLRFLTLPVAAGGVVFLIAWAAQAAITGKWVW